MLLTMSLARYAHAMTRLTRTLAGLCLLSAALPGWAQTSKPGLWDIQHKMGGGPQAAQMDQAMARMQQQMANMPPEQRKMVEDMMARQGMRMGAAPGGGMSLKVCLTREMVERNDLPTQQRGDCKTEASPRVGNTMKFKFNCSNPSSSGEGTYTFVSDDAYQMKMTMQHQEGGQAQTTTMESQGKWLGADCGDIKPMAMPKR